MGSYGGGCGGDVAAEVAMALAADEGVTGCWRSLGSLVAHLSVLKWVFRGAWALRPDCWRWDGLRGMMPALRLA